MTAPLTALRDRLPEGVPVPVRWLHAQGISSALVHRYVRSGWLQALPGQAYLRPGGEPGWPAALYAAQQLGLSVHVGHLSALALYGLTHYVAPNKQPSIHCYLESPPPTWLRAWPGLQWHGHRVVNDRAEPVILNPLTLRGSTADLPVARKLGVAPAPRAPWPVIASTPERAALELAAGLTRGESWDTAYETFTGLTMLRPALIRDLLLACPRIVTRRVFLHLADMSGHAWLRQVDLTDVDLGRGDRQVVPQGRLDPVWRVTVPRLEGGHDF